MPNKITVETQDEGEDSDYVVCALVTEPLYFADNMVSECCKCGQKVQFRPHAPKLPPRICMSCIKPDMEREAEIGELEVMITPKTAADLADYFRKKNAN